MEPTHPVDEVKTTKVLIQGKYLLGGTSRKFDRYNEMFCLQKRLIFAAAVEFASHHSVKMDFAAWPPQVIPHNGIDHEIIGLWSVKIKQIMQENAVIINGVVITDKELLKELYFKAESHIERYDDKCSRCKWHTIGYKAVLRTAGSPGNRVSETGYPSDVQQCQNPDCAMRLSFYFEYIDEKFAWVRQEFERAPEKISK